jgi:hypothetical protein
MTVIKKPQSISNVAQKKQPKTSAVQSVREPSIITEMGDTDFGDLGPLKDGQIVSYDSTTNKFVLITADQLLGISAEDDVIPDQFVTTLEGELNLGQIQLENLDGGVF